MSKINDLLAKVESLGIAKRIFCGDGRIHLAFKTSSDKNKQFDPHDSAVYSYLEGLIDGAEVIANKMSGNMEIFLLKELDNAITIAWYALGHHYNENTFFEAVVQEYGDDDMRESHGAFSVCKQWWRNEMPDGKEDEMVISKCKREDEGSYPVTAIYR